MQERLRWIAERQRVASQAAFESDLLRTWRARRRKTQGRPYVTGKSASDLPGDLTQGYRTASDESIKDHRLQWRDFEKVHADLRARSMSCQLWYDDVPWIPDGVSAGAYLAHVARAEHGSDIKKAYAAMCLTWHPDKFQNRYMGFFKDEDTWRRVVTRVNETFAGFSEAMESGVQAEDR